MKFKEYINESSMDSDKIKKKTITLFHGVKKTENVDKILKGGFKLSFIKPQWENDYAISAMTTKRSIEQFFGKRITTILKFKFSGNVYFYEHFGSGPYSAQFSSSAQNYTRAVLKDSIDASRLYADRGPYQYFIYNVKKISNIQIA